MSAAQPRPGGAGQLPLPQWKSGAGLSGRTGRKTSVPASGAAGLARAGPLARTAHSQQAIGGNTSHALCPDHILARTWILAVDYGSCAGASDMMNNVSVPLP